MCVGKILRPRITSVKTDIADNYFKTRICLQKLKNYTIYGMCGVVVLDAQVK